MFESYLNAEIIKIEKKRLEIFISVLASAIALTFILWIFYDEMLSGAFRNPFSFPLIIIWGCIMLVLLLVSRSWVSTMGRNEGYLFKSYLWYTVIVEVFLPASWLIVASIVEETSDLLDSPIIFLYYIIIIVSSLHLDFKISAGMGLLIGLSYAGFTYWATHTYPVEYNLPKIMYYVRACIYLMSGVCAGMVARELRRRLSITYNQIREKKTIESLFSQQVSKEVVEALKVKQDFSARMEVTIVFMDVRDFTKIVQNLAPEEVNRFQNKLLSPIVDIVNNHKGIINQIMGDGVMATFGAPVNDQNHQLSAWKAVNETLSFLKTFRRENPQYSQIKMGIGMHCGDVVVGNIGTESRKQFSVSGTPVIIASRIEQLNKEFDSTLLMSRILFDKLKANIEQHETVGMIKMKGLEHEIEIIKIL